MPIRRWNTSFEWEQLKKLTHTIALYESSTVLDHGNDDMSISTSDSSSSTSSSGSSSSSSSSSSLISLCNMNRIQEGDKLLDLVITTQQLNRKIHSNFADHHVQWGKCVPCRRLIRVRMYRELSNEEGLSCDFVGKVMAEDAPSTDWSTGMNYL